MIDVSRRPVQQGERYHVISDDEAEAQFYNNLGVHALVKSDLPMAYAYFRLAEETMPGLPYIWSNLGVVLNRTNRSKMRSWPMKQRCNWMGGIRFHSITCIRYTRNKAT